MEKIFPADARFIFGRKKNISSKSLRGRRQAFSGHAALKFLSNITKPER